MRLGVKMNLKVKVKFNEKGVGLMDGKGVDVTSELVEGSLRGVLISLEDTLDSLSNKIDLLCRQSNALAENYGELSEKINKLGNLLNKYYILPAGNNRIKELLELLERNVKSLAVSEYMRSNKFKEKSKRTGEMSNRFNHAVGNDELIRLYEANGYKLTNDIVDYFNAKGANITYYGLRKRLIAIGVWKGKQK